MKNEGTDRIRSLNFILPRSDDDLSLISLFDLFLLLKLSLLLGQVRAAFLLGAALSAVAAASVSSVSITAASGFVRNIVVLGGLDLRTQQVPQRTCDTDG